MPFAGLTLLMNAQNGVSRFFLTQYLEDPVFPAYDKGRNMFANKNKAIFLFLLPVPFKNVLGISSDTIEAPHETSRSASVETISEGD